MLRKLLTALALLALAGSTAPAVGAGAILYVNHAAVGKNDGSGWPDAFTSLQDALALATEGDEIWVAAGVYTPTASGGGRRVSFNMIPGVALYGGFSGDEVERDERDPGVHQTTLSGDLLDNDGPDFAHTQDNSIHVVTLTVSGAAPLLDGFTVRAGNASGHRDRPDSRGGGVYIATGAFALVNCVVENCQAAYGGGLYKAGAGTVTLTGCIVRENSAHGGGGACGSFQLLNTRFELNLAVSRGGAVYGGCFADHTEFIQNRAGRKGGAIMGGATLTHCRLVQNRSGGDGGVCFGRQRRMTATNSLFIGNHAARYGGVVYAHGRSNPFLNHCTLVSNATDQNKATICYTRDHSAPGFSNSILWHNYQGEVIDPYNCQFWVYGNHDEIIRACCVEGIDDVGDPHGNTANDPRFVDLLGEDEIVGTEDDNLRLMGDSPCIDAGWKDEPVPTEPTDLDDALRCLDDPKVEDTGKGEAPLPDMGAYEFERK